MTSAASRLALVGVAVGLAVGCSAPTPRLSPSPDGGGSPEATASIPAATPASDGKIAVDVAFADDPAGRSVRLLIVDRSGRLLGARDATLAEQAIVSGLASGVGLALLPTDATALVVTWAGWICDTTARLTIDVGLAALTVEGGPVPPCDAMSVGRGVVLRFDGPVQVGRLATSLEQGPVVDVRPQREIEGAALAVLGGRDWEVSRSLLAAASIFESRIQPPDRLVWAVVLENRGTVGGCPSLAPDVDPFTAAPCPAAGQATLFLDALSGTYVGVSYAPY